MVYYAYFHSIIRYGIIFWGNSSYTINVFYFQKRMIRIITGIRNRTLCKRSFIALKILTPSSLYIYSLSCFVVDNMDQYYFVSGITSWPLVRKRTIPTERLFCIRHTQQKH
jgi:hypothetical protein